jgi:hypothetical protein
VISASSGPSFIAPLWPDRDDARAGAVHVSRREPGVVVARRTAGRRHLGLAAHRRGLARRGRLGGLDRLGARRGRVERWLRREPRLSLARRAHRRPTSVTGQVQRAIDEHLAAAVEEVGLPQATDAVAAVGEGRAAPQQQQLVPRRQQPVAHAPAAAHAARDDRAPELARRAARRLLPRRLDVGRHAAAVVVEVHVAAAAQQRLEVALRRLPDLGGQERLELAVAQINRHRRVARQRRGAPRRVEEPSTGADRERAVEFADRQRDRARHRHRPLGDRPAAAGQGQAARVDLEVEPLGADLAAEGDLTRELPWPPPG